MRIVVRTILICACLVGVIGAQEESQGLKTRIGVLNPEVGGNDEKLGKEVLENLKKSITEMGLYEIYSQVNMEKAFGEIQERFPRYCREPQCVCAVGRALQLDRMVYGSAEKTEKTFAVQFTLMDVPSRKVVKSVNIEGDPGVPLADVVSVAVKKLHGYVDNDLDTNVHTYFGKQVNNWRQLYISAGSCIAAGVAWTLINGNTVEGEPVIANYDPWERSRCGVGTGADLIPMFARPAALGNAYAAASDDAYGVFYNPAGLSWASGGEASFGYQPRFGLNNFAASFVNKASREVGFGQGFLYTGDDEGLMSEVYFVTGISYKVNDLFKNIFPFLRPFSIGASVKILSKRIGGGSNLSPSSTQGSATGVGLNLGMQIEVSEKIRGAILVKNAPSVIRWNNESTSHKYFENEPTELILGGSFQANYATFLICEGHIPVYADQVWKGACGIERIIFRVMRIRVGVEKSEGFDTPWQVTSGFGLKIRTDSFFGKYLILDVSYGYNQEASFSNVMNYSMRYGF